MKSEFPVRLYRHLKTGGIYQQLCEANMEATQERVIVYKSLADGAIWVRPKEEFLQKFEYAGQLTK